MFNFNKDDKVFIIETRDGEIKRAEWTEVERTYVDSSGWNCETVIVLKNNVTMFGSQGDNSRVQKNIADKVLVNQIVGGCFSFLSKSKEDCIEHSTRFLAGETAFLNGDIVKLQIRIEKINETIDKIKEL
jgi:hypothetical protein